MLPERSSAALPVVSPQMFLKVLEGLRHIHPDSPGFRSPGQHLAAAVIAQRPPHAKIAVVLPTGIGKTVALMAAMKTWDDGRIVLIVVPTVALAAQYPIILGRHDFVSHRWARDDTFSNNLRAARRGKCHAIIFSVEDQPQAANYCDMVIGDDIHHHSNDIAAVVIDEFPNWQNMHKYRPDMLSDIARLTDVGVPLIMMSATVPVNVTNPLYRALSLNPKNVAVIREQAVTHGRGVHIKFNEVTSRDVMLSQCADFVSERLSLRKIGKTIVFGFSIEMLKSLGVLLSEWRETLVMYYGKMDERDKVQSQSRFMDSARLMLATTAFGYGIDAPS